MEGSTTSLVRANTKRLRAHAFFLYLLPSTLGNPNHTYRYYVLVVLFRKFSVHEKREVDHSGRIIAKHMSTHRCGGEEQRTATCSSFLVFLLPSSNNNNNLNTQLCAESHSTKRQSFCNRAPRQASSCAVAGKPGDGHGDGERDEDTWLGERGCGASVFPV